jgi:hypothetical protein
VEVLDLKSNLNRNSEPQGTVVEFPLDKGKGYVAEGIQVLLKLRLHGASW